MRTTSLTSLTSLTAAAGWALLLLVGGCSKSSGPTTTSTDASTQTGPLSAYFTKVSAGYNEVDYATLWRTSQDVVTTCMRDAGFEYTPQDTSPSLSIDEAGCQGKAQREVYETGTFAAFSDPAFASLQDEISQVYDNVPTGSRLTELEAAWSSCMSDAGYFATAPDAPNSISDTFNELSSVSVTDPSTGPTPDTTVIADPRAVEIATAVADVRCKESVDDDAKYRKVQLALAQEFVDSHKTELDAWVAAFSQDAQ